MNLKDAGGEQKSREELSKFLEALEADFPEVLKQTRSSTRKGLLELQKALPVLKQLIQEEILLREAADRGRQALIQTSSLLKGIGSSTENAVNEIFEMLQHIVYSEPEDLDSKKSLKEIRDYLMKAMNALQFQDIVAQQIKAVQSILAALDDELKAMMGGKVEMPDPTHASVEDAFDPNARFDRDRAEVSQDDIDSWIKDSTQQSDDSGEQKD